MDYYLMHCSLRLTLHYGKPSCLIKYYYISQQFKYNRRCRKIVISYSVLGFFFFFHWWIYRL